MNKLFNEPLTPELEYEFAAIKYALRWADEPHYELVEDLVYFVHGVHDEEMEEFDSATFEEMKRKLKKFRRYCDIEISVQDMIMIVMSLSRIKTVFEKGFVDEPWCAVQFMEYCQKHLFNMIVIRHKVEIDLSGVDDEGNIVMMEPEE